MSPRDRLPKSSDEDCDVDLLDALLDDALNAHEESDLIEHLGECESCQRRLDQRAAEPETWGDAERFLPDEPYDEFSVSRFEEEAPVDPVSTQIRSVLQVLDPTDIPSSMGRLGPYEVTGVIGSGGMGIVLKGMDPSLDRIVAIKVLAPHLACSGAARQRFGREAKAAAAVLHPNVIAIHGVANEVALPFLVMPYLRGRSLQRRIDQDGPLDPVDVLRIAVQVASGLAAAHSHGLVHRDIKPANILLEEGVERVTITDFGLARAVDDASMTRSGVIAGTPQYMSPEQARGVAIDCRSDLFSLGSAMYTMCTGHSPFRAETSFGVLRRITDEEPRPIREINPAIPSWLCRLVVLLQSKDVERRIQSAEEVESICRQCLTHVEQPDSHRVPELLRDEKLTVSPLKLIVAVMVVGLLLAAAIPFLLPDNPAPLRISGDRTQSEESDASRAATLGVSQSKSVQNAVRTNDSAPPANAKWSRADAQWSDDVAASLLEMEASLEQVERESTGFFLPGPEKSLGIENLPGPENLSVPEITEGDSIKSNQNEIPQQESR
ncbi:MAG: serine/threonine-protein kinase [Rubripirellula sp.]